MLVSIVAYPELTNGYSSGVILIVPFALMMELHGRSCLLSVYNNFLVGF